MNFDFFCSIRFFPLYLLFLSHIASDYLFQTRGFVRKKRRQNRYLLFHGLVVWVVTLLFFLPYQNLVVYSTLTGMAILHLTIDKTKIQIKKSDLPLSEKALNILDQALHFLVIILLWRLIFFHLPFPFGSSFFQQHPFFLKYFAILIIILIAAKALPNLFKKGEDNDSDLETGNNPTRN